VPGGVQARAQQQHQERLALVAGAGVPAPAGVVQQGGERLQRSLAWLVGYRRLQVRYERRADILLGFLYLACAQICLKSLNNPKA
jgi:hypothetical protein